MTAAHLTKYEQYKQEFVELCNKFECGYQESWIKEAYRSGAEPYDYLYEVYGDALEDV